MSTLGIGVVGCGGMGRAILERVLASDPRLKVKALYDPDPRSVEQAKARLDADAKVCETYQQVVEAKEVDWVMIASWNNVHCEQVVAAFNAGKHVFCQKPLAVSLDQCIAMNEACKKSGRRFVIGFTLRFSPHYRKIKQLLDDDAIGRIVSFEFNETLDFNHGGYIMGDWRRLRQFAGTHLLEKCCHDIDLANWMVESRVRRAASFGGLDFFVPENAHHVERIGKSKEGHVPYKVWPGLVGKDPFADDKDIVDNQVAILEYENRVRATFHTNCNAGIPERRMYILGTEGAIRADVLVGTIQLKRIGFDTPLEDVSTEASGGHGGGDDVLVAELVDTMLNGTPPSVGMKEGVESSVACFAVDDAMDSGQVVDLTPYWERVGELSPTRP